MGKSYNTKHRERKVMTFELDGRQFSFRAPKNSHLVLPLIGGNDAAPVTAMFNWLSDGLSEEDNQFIIDRLQDDDDDFDIDDLQEIVEDLIAEATGRPTKPRPVSSR